tara:strand:+ start:251 stop:607 length:357 start_codon:yes stop_codon:yes gene_type:complete
MPIKLVATEAGPKKFTRKREGTLQRAAKSIAKAVSPLKEAEVSRAFSIARGMLAPDKSEKAGGGKVKKKSKGMAKGGKRGGAKKMAKGGMRGGPRRMMKNGGKAMKSKGMKRGGKAKR